MWPEFGEAELRRAIFAYAKETEDLVREPRKSQHRTPMTTLRKKRKRTARWLHRNSSSVRTTTTSGSTAAGAATGAAASSGSIIGNNNNNNKNNAGGGTRSQQPSSGSINALTLGGESNVLNSSKNSDIPPSQE